MSLLYGRIKTVLKYLFLIISVIWCVEGLPAQSSPIGTLHILVTAVGHNPDGTVFPVYFDETVEAWVVDGELAPLPAAGAYGISAALLAKNDTLVALVGDRDYGARGGVVTWIRVHGVWNKEVVIQAQDEPGNDLLEFGEAVSVVGLGSGEALAIIGDSRSGSIVTQPAGPGAAFIVLRDATTGAWSQEERILAPNGSESEAFGASVSVVPLSGGHPGDVLALVGAPRRPFFTTREGRALAFTRDGATGTWAFEEEFIYPDGPDVGEFDTEVALLPVPNGEPGEVVALIGAPFANVCSALTSGAAYAFHRTPKATWTHEDTLCSQAQRTHNHWGSAIAMDAHPYVPLGESPGPVRALVGARSSDLAAENAFCDGRDGSPVGGRGGRARPRGTAAGPPLTHRRLGATRRCVHHPRAGRRITDAYHRQIAKGGVS